MGDDQDRWGQWVVYLLHFDRRLGNEDGIGYAMHYLGSTHDLKWRLKVHESGRGAHITAAAVRAGITFVLARTWPGDRTRERQLKGRPSGSRGLRHMCPVCHPMPRITQFAHRAERTRGMIQDDPWRT